MSSPRPTPSRAIHPRRESENASKRRLPLQAERETQLEALREYYRAIRPIVEARPLLAWEPEIAGERRTIETLSEKVSGHPHSDTRLSVEDCLHWLHKLSLEAEAFVAALPKGELDGRIEEGLDPIGRTTRRQGRASR